jgi:hypothetical protein
MMSIELGNQFELELWMNMSVTARELAVFSRLVFLFFIFYFYFYFIFLGSKLILVCKVVIMLHFFSSLLLLLFFFLGQNSFWYAK